MRGAISRSHLERRAIVYVRQSTTMQVFEHVESKQRQYALADRAKALGWSPTAIEIIDADQGKSGATTEGRIGFARVADAVAHGEAGAIFALEVSRLARCSEDWQRLLALCAVAGVVVVDEQSIYDPADKDDKLLLDLKGTMSEAELHWLRLRLQGGRQHKARKGELWLTPATGYVWGDRGYDLDPDESVRTAVRTVFERFAIEPSAYALARWANEVGFQFPSRSAHGELAWKPLSVGRVRELLHNPVYTGTYVYGRRPSKKVLVDGAIRVKREPGNDPNAWLVKIDKRHPAYIDWDTFVANKKKLANNVSLMNGATSGAPREGGALIGGLVICGRCGRRMRTDYATAERAKWLYVCFEHMHARQVCWSVPGRRIDAAVEQMFIDRMVPSELDLSLAVERQVEGQASSLTEQWKTRLEQVRYEARRAERRYKAVDPDNRVVARTLEREWEERLREVEEVERQFADARRTRRVELSDDDRARIRELAKNLPIVWRASTTRSSERKAMLRLVIDAIALVPVDVPRRETLVRVQWKSGNVTELRVPRPAKFQTSATALRRVRQLAKQQCNDQEIADRLNREQLVTGSGREWTPEAVGYLRRRERIACGAHRPYNHPLPATHPTTGRYSVPGAMKAFGVSRRVVRGWIARGLVDAEKATVAGKPVYWLSIDERAANKLRTRMAKRYTTHS
jgi:DNA invertase Pin-like site-specific DNA recombinase